MWRRVPSRQTREVLERDACERPQGQPNDIGSIEGAGVRFDVTDVRSKVRGALLLPLDRVRHSLFLMNSAPPRVNGRHQDGVVYHYGSFASGSGASFSPGAPVSLAIDEARRRLHARVRPSRRCAPLPLGMRSRTGRS